MELRKSRPKKKHSPTGLWNKVRECWDWAAPYSMTINDITDPKGPANREDVTRYLKNPYMLQFSF